MVDKVFTTDEFAETLKVKPGTIRQWHWRGYIKGIKIGGTVRYSEDEVNRVLTQGLDTTKQERD